MSLELQDAMAVVRVGLSAEDQAELVSLPIGIQDEVRYLQALFDAIGPDEKLRPACRAIAEAHQHRRGFRTRTLLNKLHAYRRTGDWRVLVDAVRAGWRDVEKLPAAFVEFWRSLCDQNQRKDKPAYRVLMLIWRTHRHPISKEWMPEIPGYSEWPKLGRTGNHPAGWSYANLARHSPPPFEKALARQGRSAAAAHRPLVYTTRAELWVGSHYLFDDLWHDNFVNVLDTGKTGRPLEFGAFDLFSACKFAWGMRVRTESDATGQMEGLKESMMRYLLASALSQHGYSERGTVLVVEHGAAAIREDMEKVLHDLSGGLITVARSGIDGGGDALGIYAGRGKGNFRFKAAYESLHNLVHNDFASLPAQTGMSVERRPEALHGQLKANDALVKAMIALREENPDLASLLQLDVLEWGAFLALALELYDRINGRTEHDLEGWRKNVALVNRAGRPYFRRMSPTEVWQRDRDGLRRFDPVATAMILGPDLGFARRIRDAVTEVEHKENGPDPLKFDTHKVAPGEYQVVLNPFQADRVFLFDTRGAFVTVCPRIWRVSPRDVVRLREEFGRVKRVEAEMMAPARARGAALVRKAIARARNNAEVLAEGEARRVAGGRAQAPQIRTRVTEDDLSEAGPSRTTGQQDLVDEQLKMLEQL